MHRNIVFVLVALYFINSFATPSEKIEPLPQLPRISADQFSFSHQLLPEGEQTLAKTSDGISSGQILIKVHIVKVDQNFTQSLGLIFNTSTSTMTTSGGFIMNLPATSENDFTIPIAKLSQGILLDATLSALEKQGHAKLISDPQLVTLDRQTATIESGEEIPYQESAYNGGTSTTFKKAVLKLLVTPEIQSGNHVLLHLSINQDQVSTLTFNGVPAISTRELRTQVIMKDHTTLILGGIFEENKSDQHQSVPILNQIPIIGNLFKYHEKVDNRSQLLIFVTPIILHE